MEFEKTTPCGRFTVTVSTNTPLDTAVFVQDGVRSLKNLSDLLSEASQAALKAAVQMLELYGVTGSKS